MQKDNLLEPFEITISVIDDDIDVNGHVNNTVYLRWIQDVAIAHWNYAAAEHHKTDVVWVVIRHEIDYKAALFKGDVVTARTWVGKASEITFERHTEIINSGSQKLAAKARSLWVPVSTKTGKPTRVDEELRKRFSA